MVRNEIAVLKRVSAGHKNIVQLHDFFETTHNLYVRRRKLTWEWLVDWSFCSLSLTFVPVESFSTGSVPREATLRSEAQSLAVQNLLYGADVLGKGCCQYCANCNISRQVPP